MSQSDRTVIPGEPKDGGRDPGFGKLTTLSRVEGESREVAENQIILDPPPLSAGDHELRHSISESGFLTIFHFSLFFLFSG